MPFLFALTLFVSAMLLFFVQPMVAKMILPMFGGTPAVWNTCMVFFQAALLAGYAYAHASVRWLGVRRQPWVHLLLLVLALLVLPIGMGNESPPPADGNPVFWLLWRLLILAGPPFFIVSSSAPLLQRWFAATDHTSAKDPYFLYATSNCGSLVALIGYPLLAEPALRLTHQSEMWSMGYVALIALTAVCAWTMWRRPSSEPDPSVNGRAISETGAATHDEHADMPTTAHRLWWVALAFVPSSLMLGVTTHITTDLAPIPLLWVAPLALYLATFVLVFAKTPLVRSTTVQRILPNVLLVFAPCLYFWPPTAATIAIPFHLFVFFLVALACHGDLATRRPAARYLTEFYLWMSVGGVLGGVFNAILAPIVFTSVLEYPLALVLACLLRRRSTPDTDSRRRVWRNLALPALLLLLTAGIIAGLQSSAMKGTWVSIGILFFPTTMFCFALKESPIRFGIGYAVILGGLGWYADLQSGSTLHAERNFFGVKQVKLHASGDRRIFIHGTTAHGMQNIDPKRAAEPLAYYHRTGPLGDVFSAYGGAQETPYVAVIGLGVGIVATYIEPGQHVTFYEIDPAVERIASDTRYFTFLADCRGTCDVVLGDGRLTLARATNHHYRMIIVDAFSADAVPAHLLSREALQMFLSKLDERGLLLFHISNRYLDLVSVLAALAHDANLACLVRRDTKVGKELAAAGKMPSEYLIMARRPEHLSRLSDDSGWETPPVSPDVRVWTDQYCNILQVLRGPSTWKKQPNH